MSPLTAADRKAILQTSVEVHAMTLALRSTLLDLRGEATRQRARSVRLRADARVVREHWRR